MRASATPEQQGKGVTEAASPRWDAARKNVRHGKRICRRGARTRPSASISVMQSLRRYGDTHCTEKLDPSDEGADGTASGALVLALTIVMANTLAPGNVLKAPLCELSEA